MTEAAQLAAQITEVGSKFDASLASLRTEFEDARKAGTAEYGDVKAKLGKFKEEFADNAKTLSDLAQKAEADAKAREELEAKVIELERKGVRVNASEDPDTLKHRIALTEIRNELKGEGSVFGDESDKQLATVDDLQRLDAAFKRYAVGNAKEFKALRDSAPAETFEAGSSSFSPRYGLTIPPALTGRILQPLFTTGSMFGLALERTVNSDIVKLMRFEGKVAIKRGGSDQEISYTVGNVPEGYPISYPVNNLAAIIQLGKDIQDDSATDLVGMLTMNAQMAYMEDVGDQHINGNGKRGTAVGILTPSKTDMAVTALTPKTLDAREVGAGVVAVKSGSNSALGTSTASDATYNFDPLKKAIHSLHSRYMASGLTIICNRMTLADYATMKNRDGDYQVREATVNAMGMGTLLGIPVRVNDQMPAVAQNAYPVAVGAWKEAYEISTRRGMYMLVDPFTQALDTRWIFNWRLGSRVADDRAYRLIKIST